MTLGERWYYPNHCGFCGRPLTDTEQRWYSEVDWRTYPLPHCGTCAAHLSDLCEWSTDP